MKTSAMAVSSTGDQFMTTSYVLKPGNRLSFCGNPRRDW
jgi:hypothetical protein